MPDFDTLVPAPELTLPIQFCRFFAYPRATALERERECRNSIRERQLCSRDVGFVTWRSSSYVQCTHIFNIRRCMLESEFAIAKADMVINLVLIAKKVFFNLRCQILSGTTWLHYARLSKKSENDHFTVYAPTLRKCC